MNIGAITCFASVDIEESLHCGLPTVFLDGHQRSLLSDSKLWFWFWWELSCIVCSWSARISSWMDCLLLLVLKGTGRQGEQSRFLVIIWTGGKEYIQTINGVTPEHLAKCRVTELKNGVKESKRWCDSKHHLDASFYPFHGSRIIACSATNKYNSLDGWELGTKHGMWQACCRVVGWLLLKKCIITTS
jgi:hypothetical protein